MVVSCFAKALETIPRQLSDNSGMDSTDILNQLRRLHGAEDDSGLWMGVNVLEGNVDNMFDKFVWEPEIVRLNVLTAACEAAVTILSIDQTIRNPASE